MSLLGLDRRAQHHVRYNLLHHRKDLAPGLVRISFGLYNTADEIDILCDALTAIASGAHQEYTVDTATGFYTPLHESEDFSVYYQM